VNGVTAPKLHGIFGAAPCTGTNAVIQSGQASAKPYLDTSPNQDAIKCQASTLRASLRRRRRITAGVARMTLAALHKRGDSPPLHLRSLVMESDEI
jgi:hypothetical protein